MAAAAATSTITRVPVAACSSISFSETKRRIQPTRLTTTDRIRLPAQRFSRTRKCHFTTVSCLPPAPLPLSKTHFNPSTRLFVSGLSFRTTEESLTNAFKAFGELLEVNLVMDKIANRPRGFAFIRYATQEESQKAIEGMHGKFLDGRVIFVEFAKSKSELRQSLKQKPKLT
ncbi:unnamed protein product [Coffea canephora]|uniref:RRM domain-containing protein n=1 Tax=Coffea canephora TaxID=49390 RepID=A0A068TTD0_COFCA|nr:unnamed protein product [Coffea canephora]